MIFYTKQGLKINKTNQPHIDPGKLPGLLVIGLITIYQWTLSPDHGIPSLYTIGVCKYRPTCSQYTKEIIQSYGLIQGVKRGWKQIKKCH